MSVGDSGVCELAFLRACSPSRAMVMPPEDMSCFKQAILIVSSIPDMPASSLR